MLDYPPGVYYPRVYCLFYFTLFLLYSYPIVTLQFSANKSMANEKVKELIGTWKHESAENTDPYLKVS
jgi:hypothetical protein